MDGRTPTHWSQPDVGRHLSDDGSAHAWAGDSPGHVRRLRQERHAWRRDDLCLDIDRAGCWFDAWRHPLEKQAAEKKLEPSL
jgi:hypothetical protein